MLTAISLAMVSCTKDNNPTRNDYMGDGDWEFSTAKGNGSKSKTFYDFCLSNYDKDKDGTLSKEEMESVTIMDCSGEGLNDMKGLGNFTSLETLKCAHNNLKELDLSLNAKLRFLDCSYNFLEKLDVSTTNISTLYCYPMTDAAGNNLLQYLFIYRGQTIEGVTNSDRDAVKDKRIPDQTTVISVPSPKDGDTDTNKAVKP